MDYRTLATMSTSSAAYSPTRRGGIRDTWAMQFFDKGAIPAGLPAWQCWHCGTHNAATSLHCEGCNAPMKLA